VNSQLSLLLQAFDIVELLPDFDSLRADINSMAAPLDQVSQYVGDLHDVDHFVAGAQTFVSRDLVTFMDALSVSCFVHPTVCLFVIRVPL
jgi:hypothetical protein